MEGAGKTRSFSPWSGELLPMGVFLPLSSWKTGREAPPIPPNRLLPSSSSWPKTKAGEHFGDNVSSLLKLLSRACKPGKRRSAYHCENKTTARERRPSDDHASIFGRMYQRPRRTKDSWKTWPALAALEKVYKTSRGLPFVDTVRLTYQLIHSGKRSRPPVELVLRKGPTP